MKKETYNSPTTQVVKIQHEAPLLDVSTGAARNNYGTANEDTWE